MQISCKTKKLFPLKTIVKLHRKNPSKLCLLYLQYFPLSAKYKLSLRPCRQMRSSPVGHYVKTKNQPTQSSYFVNLNRPRSWVQCSSAKCFSGTNARLAIIIRTTILVSITNFSINFTKLGTSLEGFCWIYISQTVKFPVWNRLGKVRTWQGEKDTRHIF